MFTPLSALAGGALIGLSASILLAGNGRVAGISGIVGGLFDAPDRDWRGAFIGGLFVGGLIVAFVARNAMIPTISGPGVLATIISGLLVGAGTQLGNGCTSGHGVCGISRFSKRSIVATCTFMAAAFVTTFLARHVL
jgi:uncharacterized membrane protein YedE/YeeE